jgi:hypothetical protein
MNISNSFLFHSKIIVPKLPPQRKRKSFLSALLFLATDKHGRSRTNTEFYFNNNKNIRGKKTK